MFRAARGLWILSFAMGFIGLLNSCNTAPVKDTRTPASSCVGVDCSSDPHNVGILDFDLYKNEQWKGGTRDTEIAEFQDQVNRMLDAQKELQSQRKAPQAARVFHEKQHGCLLGSLNILDSRPGDPARKTYQGLFSGKKKSFNVLARFSNGVGKEQHDLFPDVRGIGIKIFGVQDEKTGDVRTVDFTMTDSPTPFGRDQEEFVEFMEANVNPGIANINLLNYFRNHPEVAERLFAASFKIIPTLTQLQYWAGHAYLLGSNLAMKLNIKPEDQENLSFVYPHLRKMNFEDQASHWVQNETSELSDLLKARDPNYLGKDLAQRALSGPIRFVLSVQLEKSAKTTPIEDNLVEWTEANTPSIPVAELVFDRQNIGDSELENICQNARFTPGHFVSQHRPLSNMGRGRIMVYRASQIGRSARAQEVEESTLLDIKAKISKN